MDGEIKLLAEARPIMITTLNLDQKMDKRAVIISPALEQIRVTCTKRGRKMAYAVLYDQYGKINLVIFPLVYKNYRNFLLDKYNVKITGGLDVSESTSFLIAESFELSER